MTSDDLSPMLPQPADDNAPMISGRGTKIIADARGAYLVGNLKGLLNLLEGEQETVFRQAFIKFSLWHADRPFQLLAPNADVRVDYERIKAALLQTAQPMTPRDVFYWGDDDYDEPTRYVNLLLSNLRCLLENHPSLNEFVRCAIESVNHAYEADQALQGGSRRYFQEKKRHQWIAWRYVSEAAWAILRGQLPVSIDEFLSDEQQVVYRTADLLSIIQRMNDKQQLTFRQALIYQALISIEQLVLGEHTDEPEPECITAIRRWLDDPTDTNIRLAVHVQKRQEFPYLPVKRRIEREASGIIDAIRVNSVARSADLVLEIAEAAHEASYDSQYRWFSHIDAARWWQIEAAWAILNNQEPPPFELPT